MTHTRERFIFQTESSVSSIRMREFLVKHIGHLCMYLHLIKIEKQQKQKGLQKNDEFDANIL